MVLGSRDRESEEQRDEGEKRRKTEVEGEGTCVGEITVTSTPKTADTSGRVSPLAVPYGSSEKTERLRRGVLEHIDTLFERPQFVADLPRLFRINCSTGVSDPSGDVAKLKEWAKKVVNSLFKYRQDVCRLNADGKDETLKIQFSGLGRKNSKSARLYRKLVDVFELPTTAPFRTNMANARNIFLHSLDCFDMSRAPTSRFFASLLPNEVLHASGLFGKKYDAALERTILRRDIQPYADVDHILLALGASPYTLRDETPVFEAPPMKLVESIRQYRDAWKSTIESQLRLQLHEFLREEDPLANGWVVEWGTEPGWKNPDFCLAVDEVRDSSSGLVRVTLNKYDERCQYLPNGTRPLQADDLVLVRFFSAFRCVNRLVFNYERWIKQCETGKEMEEMTFWARVVSVPEKHCTPIWTMQLYKPNGLNAKNIRGFAEILLAANIYQTRCQLRNLLNIVDLSPQLQKTLVDPTNTPSSLVGQPSRGYGFETRCLLDSFRRTLNHSQYEMCIRVLNRCLFEETENADYDRSGFLLVQGPPGTGKTTAIVALVNLLVEKPIAKKVLLCAPSNAAVDVLIERLLYGLKRVIRVGEHVRLEKYSPRIVRLSSTKGTPRAMTVSLDRLASDRVDPRELRCTPHDQRRNLYYKEKVGLLKSPNLQVICATLGSLGQNILRRAELGVSLVIVDEAGQCTEPEVLAPLMCADKRSYSPKTCVLVGDPMQLPPTLDFVPKGKGQDLERSLLQRLMENRTHAVGDVLCLDTQYRMHPAISYFARNQFYNGKLKDSSSVHCWEEYCMPYHYDGAGRFGPVTFIDTCRTRVFEGKDGGSRFNKIEKDIVAALLLVFHRLYDRDLKTKGCWGVLSPYRAQVKDIQQVVDRKPILKSMNISCKTVDSMQGGEKDIIILSTVRSNAGGRIGFLDDYRRFNVAFTRPRKSLIVIGNSETLGTDPEWLKFISHAQNNSPRDYRYIVLPEGAGVRKDLCPELQVQSGVSWWFRSAEPGESVKK